MLPKPDKLISCRQALYDFIDGAQLARLEVKVRKGKTFETLRYRWIEAVPFRDGKDAILVNWVGFEILDAKGRVKYKTAWVTSLPIAKDNVAELVACARARWSIESAPQAHARRRFAVMN